MYPQTSLIALLATLLLHPLLAPASSTFSYDPNHKSPWDLMVKADPRRPMPNQPAPAEETPHTTSTPSPPPPPPPPPTPTLPKMIDAGNHRGSGKTMPMLAFHTVAPVDPHGSGHHVGPRDKVPAPPAVTATARLDECEGDGCPYRGPRVEKHEEVKEQPEVRRRRAPRRDRAVLAAVVCREEALVDDGDDGDDDQENQYGEDDADGQDASAEKRDVVHLGKFGRDPEKPAANTEKTPDCYVM